LRVLGKEATAAALSGAGLLLLLSMTISMRQ
jgi:hypothetical protein